MYERFLTAIVFMTRLIVFMTRLAGLILVLGMGYVFLVLLHAVLT